MKNIKMKFLSSFTLSVLVCTHLAYSSATAPEKPVATTAETVSTVVIDQTTTLGRLIALKSVRPLCATCTTNVNNLINAGKALKGGYSQLKQLISQKEKEDRELLELDYDGAVKIPFELAVQIFTHPDQAQALREKYLQSHYAAHPAKAEKFTKAKERLSVTMQALFDQIKFDALEQQAGEAYVNFSNNSSWITKAALNDAMKEKQVVTMEQLFEQL